MINQLPNWCLTNENPSFYETESATAIEMVAKLYAKVKELIESENQRKIDMINISNKRKKREELMEKVDASYYGLQTEDIEEIELIYEEINGAPNFSPLP